MNSAYSPQSSTVPGQSGRWFRRGNTIVLELRENRKSAEEAEIEAEVELSSTGYLLWVQRSLNRILGSRLAMDGSDSVPYRTLVRQFQERHGLPVTGAVDSPTQDAIIKANESVQAYMAWVHRALERDSVFADPPLKSPGSNGSFKSTGLRLGIEAFQVRQKLKKDGFVGAKTEMALIRICGCLPPSHVVRDSPILEIMRSIGLSLSPGEIHALSSGKPVSLASRPNEFNRALANAQVRFGGGATQAAFQNNRPPSPKFCDKCEGRCFRISRRVCLCFGNGLFIRICLPFGRPRRRRRPKIA